MHEGVLSLRNYNVRYHFSEKDNRQLYSIIFNKQTPLPLLAPQTKSLMRVKHACSG